MENNEMIPNGKAYAIQILVANELKLNPPYLLFAEMYMKNELHPSSYLYLEKGASEAVKLINDNGLNDMAMKIATEKYL